VQVNLMNTKPLTFLLSLTVLFLFSGSVYGDDFQDGFDAYQEQDFKTAHKLWLPLAEQGLVNAQYNLGTMYYDGKGVPQDHKEAVRWYRLSADQGLAKAQLRLGLMYANGTGVPQDYEEAVKWYRLSAEQGNSTAQFNVGSTYLFGSPGTTQDDVQAYKWFNLAESNGNENGSVLREIVEASMSPSQISQAQEMARQWLAEHQGGKQKSGTQIAQTPQPMARIGSSEPINTNPHKEQSLQQEADRLAQERQLFEEERKKWRGSRLAEESRQQQVQAVKEPSPQSGTGSGFFVSKLGHVITNAHVVKGCKRVTVGDNANKQVPAEIVNTDVSNDLALLKLSTLEMASADSKSLIQKLSIVVVPLASKGLLRSEDVRLGEKVLVAGYPYGDVFSNTIKVTSGIVSATRGAGDDTGQFQLDAAVQPGNSGGPIYDSGGNIVGVVVAQLDKLKMAKAIGSMPENVNFGIKASTVRQFLISSGLPSKKAEQTEEKSTEQLSQIAKNQALMVMCFQ
jgi:S1-C subfamily serine protease